MCDQTFAEVLLLEQEFFEKAYEEGKSDGEAAGKLEGREIGVNYGFEKFLKLGRLHGKSLILGNRIFVPQYSLGEVSEESQTSSYFEPTPASCLLKPLHNSQKALKHIKDLHKLVDPKTLSFENDEDAISDFNDRLKKANNKERLIKVLIVKQLLKSNRTNMRDILPKVPT